MSMSYKIKLERLSEKLLTYRTVKADRVAEKLYNYYYGSLVLWLVKKHFYDSIDLDSYEGDWMWLFKEFCFLVEADDWFALDWDKLEYGFGLWMQTSDFEYKRFFSNNLIYIPVQCYGLWGMDNQWNEDALYEGDYETFGGMDVLMFLISECDIHLDHILDYDLDFERMMWVLENYKRVEVYDSLKGADFSAYKKPLRFLPDLIGLFTASTFNIILDTPQGVSNSFHSFRWDADLERLKAAWVEAKPVVKKFNKFSKWLMRDYEENVQMMIDAVIDNFLLVKGVVIDD